MRSTRCAEILVYAAPAGTWLLSLSHAHPPLPCLCACAVCTKCDPALPCSLLLQGKHFAGVAKKLAA